MIARPPNHLRRSTTRRLVVVVALVLGTVSAFAPAAPFVGSSSSSSSSSRSMSSQWDDEPSESMSFDEAGKALMEEEENARAERSGGQVTEEQLSAFEAKKSEYESMREKIRARAADLDIEKSVTTQKAIEEANRRALNREEESSAYGEATAEDAAPNLDLSRIGAGPSDYRDDDDDRSSSSSLFDPFGRPEPEDELTEEQMAAIDEVGTLNPFQQAAEEIKGTKFPTLAATLRQTGFMLVIFLFTAGYILFLDGALRDLIVKYGFVPGPDSVFDYGDLDLPEGWSDMMTDTDVTSN